MIVSQYHTASPQGNVGINIERPEHATLAVGGNVLVSGSVNHYSDQRVKENIKVRGFIGNYVDCCQF